MKPIPGLTEEDLTAWIAKNRMRFIFNAAHYTPDYVTFLARLAGFEAEMVYRRFSDFKHAMALTDPDRAAAKKITWTVGEMEHRGCYNIMKESWDDLGKYLMHGTDFK